MIKLVLSDLDSTLVWQPDHVITPFALEAVHALQAAGVHFAPCTGRYFRDLSTIFAGDDAACATAVTSNGQLVYLDGELISAVPLDRDALLGAKDVLHEIPDAYLVVEYEGEKTAVDADPAFVHAHPDNFWNVRNVLDTVPVEPCYKSNVRVVGSFERTQEVAAQLGRACPGLDFVCPMPGLPHIDVLPAGFGKECGADVLCERLGISPDEVCCFGDAENDLSVLRHFIHSVAVANASPAVAEAARYHIGPANEDSVAKAFLEIADRASRKATR